ncbi:hypothetical protein GCM10010388_73500 [Streptomyces mauvecolor]
MVHAGVLRVAPLAGETTWSFLCRVTASYGMLPGALLPWWEQTNGRPRHASGESRADAEILLNPAGQQMLAQLSGAEGGSLARALPTWPLAVFEDRTDGERPLLRWQTGAAALGPVAFGCRLCTARRTGAEVRVMRYAQRWERVCVRHGRWALDADADQPLEHLDLRGTPEAAAAQRRWLGVARHAARAGTDPGEVFGLAYAVVARWWEAAYGWEREEIWPRRLHQVAGGNAGADLERWRVVGRDRWSSQRWWPLRMRCWIRPWRSWCGPTAGVCGRGLMGRTECSVAVSGRGWEGRGWGR